MQQSPAIDYGKLVDEAMHVIVHKVLKMVQENGLPGNHHFFISFSTKHPGVKISQNLINKYPQEMTIVLQYQFQNLIINTKGFEVTLSFGGIKERICIPFSAITTFADPSVQFGLQFRDVEHSDYIDETNLELDVNQSDKLLNESKEPTDKAKNKLIKKKGKKSSSQISNVISLDNFRKK